MAAYAPCGPPPPLPPPPPCHSAPLLAAPAGGPAPWPPDPCALGPGQWQWAAPPGPPAAPPPLSGPPCPPCPPCPPGPAPLVHPQPLPHVSHSVVPEGGPPAFGRRSIAEGSGAMPPAPAVPAQPSAPASARVLPPPPPPPLATHSEPQPDLWAALANERALCQREMALQQQRLGAAEADRDQLRAQLAQLEGRLKLAQAEPRSVTAANLPDFNILQAQLTACTQKRMEVEGERAHLLAEVTTLRQASSAAQVQELQARLSIAEGERERVGRQLGALEARVREEAAARAAAEDTVARLRAAQQSSVPVLPPTPSVTPELLEARNAQARLEAQAGILQRQAQAADAARELAGQQVQAAQTRLAVQAEEHAGLQARLAEARILRTQLETERTQLQGELTELRAHATRIPELERERERLAQEVTRLQLQVGTLRTREAEEATAHDEATLQLAQVDAQHLRAQLEAAELERVALMQAMHALEGRLAKEAADRALAVAQLGPLQAMLTTLQATPRMAEQGMERVELQTQVVALRREAEEARGEVRRLEAMLMAASAAAARKPVDLPPAEPSGLRGEANALRAQTQSLLVERDGAVQEAGQWRARYREVNEALQGAQGEIAKLQMRVSELGIEAKNCAAQLQFYAHRPAPAPAAVAAEPQPPSQRPPSPPPPARPPQPDREPEPRPQTTFKVQTLELAHQVAALQTAGDGTLAGLPIEVVGQGLYSDILRQGQVDSQAQASVSSSATAPPVTALPAPIAPVAPSFGAPAPYEAVAPAPPPASSWAQYYGGSTEYPVCPPPPAWPTVLPMCSSATAIAPAPLAPAEAPAAPSASLWAQCCGGSTEAPAPPPASSWAQYYGGSTDYPVCPPPPAWPEFLPPYVPTATAPALPAPPPEAPAPPPASSWAQYYGGSTEYPVCPPPPAWPTVLPMCSSAAPSFPAPAPPAPTPVQVPEPAPAAPWQQFYSGSMGYPAPSGASALASSSVPALPPPPAPPAPGMGCGPAEPSSAPLEVSPTRDVGAGREQLRLVAEKEARIRALESESRTLRDRLAGADGSRLVAERELSRLLDAVKDVERRSQEVEAELTAHRQQHGMAP